jgi:hypothetical protein
MRFLSLFVRLLFLQASLPRNLLSHNILHSQFDILNFSAPWTAFVPPPPLRLNQKNKIMNFDLNTPICPITSRAPRFDDFGR